MKLFESTWKPNTAEVHQYTLDLERITLLRDKCQNVDERAVYNETIKVMQKVLIFLNKIPS